MSLPLPSCLCGHPKGPNQVRKLELRTPVLFLSCFVVSRALVVRAGEVLTAGHGLHRVGFTVPTGASHPTVPSRPIWIGRYQIEDTPSPIILQKGPYNYLDLNPPSLHLF